MNQARFEIESRDAEIKRLREAVESMLIELRRTNVFLGRKDAYKIGKEALNRNRKDGDE